MKIPAPIDIAVLYIRYVIKPINSDPIPELVILYGFPRFLLLKF